MQCNLKTTIYLFWLLCIKSFSGRDDGGGCCLLPTTHDVVKKKPPASAHSEEEEEESLQLHKPALPGFEPITTDLSTGRVLNSTGVARMSSDIL